MAVSFYTLFTPMNLPALTPRHNTSGRLAIWIVLVFLFTACCNDREVAQLQRDSTEHAAELREIQDASLSYVYIEYERNLENTLWFAGHCWDKTLTLEAFLLLLGLMLAFTILVKRVPFIYQWLDGSPEIGLNTMCLVSVAFILMGLHANPLSLWYIPTLISLVGIALMVVSFYYPHQTGWLSNRWFKYLRRLYLLLFAAFVIMCFYLEPELPMIVD